MRIRTYILSASAAVAAVFLAVGYLLGGEVLERTVRENARQSSDAMARTTFTAMYQVMSTGWKRKQAEKFLTAIRESTIETPTTVEIYRGANVISEYGAIEQPRADARLTQALADGQPFTETAGSGVRHVMPLVANDRCLRCHEQVKEGDVLGAIEVRQDFTPLVAKARREFLWLALAMLPLLLAVAALLVWRVNRRLEQSIAVVQDAVGRVNSVGDLRRLEFEKQELGFVELNRLFAELSELTGKLRAISIDKDVLRFEIGLLEKFVITSEVVRDWGEYIARLLAEINTVLTTHMLFSIFQVDDEVFDLEIFWSRNPVPETRARMEAHIRELIGGDTRFRDFTQITVNHHVPPALDDVLSLAADEVVIHTKALIVDKPRIGGIVGIGVAAETESDDTRRLVMDSVLSTMLNVVGSIKAIHKYTRDMEYYATRDPLTDLFNRRVFTELLDYEIGRSMRHDYSFALLVVDLDNFKLINDGYGHAFGDRYLQEFTRALRKELRPGDIFARHGGDEFTVLLPDIGIDEAATVAQRLLEAGRTMGLESPDGRKLAGSASIGLALYPSHAGSAKDLFLFADQMMYKAKAAGKSQVGVPTREEVAEVFRDMTDTTVLVVNAIDDGRIVPFFQPILSLDGNEVAGFEVLSRIHVEGDRPIEASRFIEYAEKAGVIHRLDEMVMSKALNAMAASGFKGHLFINLSPRALAISDFLSILKRTVAESGVSPSQIVFEITERDTVKNMAVLERLVNGLKLDGYKLAIDDFGSGFSSFQYLRRFQVDFLKIEGDFVMNMLESEKDRAFVQTIWHLAHELKIKVIAEHVESEQVLHALNAIGVEMAQGYYVGRPAPDLALPERFRNA